MSLGNFYVGTTKIFTVAITKDGNVPNITADRVRIIFKKKKSFPDSEAVIDEDANVITNGGLGQATFTLTDEMTCVNSGNYFEEITWYPSTGEEYLLDSKQITLYERTTDV